MTTPFNNEGKTRLGQKSGPHRLVGYIENLADLPKMVTSLLLSLLIGCVDYITGDYSLSICYFIPTAFASWFIGKKSGISVALLCSVQLVVIDMMSVSGYGSIFNIKLWNSVIECAFIFLSGYLIYTVKVQIKLVNQKSNELEAANKKLESFNYTVAHDLRQPLNILSTCYQTITMLFGDQLPEECIGYLHQSFQATMRMNRLIEVLLKFSRIGSLEPRRVMVDLSLLVHEVANELKLTDPGRQVDFRISEGVVANADADLTRVALENLLGNAWKYTSSRENAIIEFGVTKVDGVPTYFIRDNGEGFDKAYADQLFVPFRRLPGAEAHKGLGIGLATVESIIRHHGGKIWAEGEPGKGAIFFFTIPEI